MRMDAAGTELLEWTGCRMDPNDPLVNASACGPAIRACSAPPRLCGTIRLAGVGPLRGQTYGSGLGRRDPAGVDGGLGLRTGGWATAGYIPGRLRRPGGRPLGWGECVRPAGST